MFGPLICVIVLLTLLIAGIIQILQKHTVSASPLDDDFDVEAFAIFDDITSDD